MPIYADKIFLLDVPPQRVRLKINGNAVKIPEPYSCEKEREGLYMLQSGMINGHRYWMKPDRSFGVWYANRPNSDISFWIFGTEDILGKPNGYIKSPHNNENWPSDINCGWMYPTSVHFQWKIGSLNEILVENESKGL